MADSTLSEAIKEAYASAPVDEIIYHTLEIDHPDFTTPIRVVRDSVALDAILESGIAYDWHFDQSIENWTAVNATATASGGVLQVVITSAGSRITSPIIAAIDGSVYPVVRARVRRTAGTATWEGSVYYVTGAHGFDGGYIKTVSHPDPGNEDEWAVVEWDMSNLTAGGTDWTDATDITRIRIDLVIGTGDTWEVDWVSIGQDYVTFTPYAFDVVPPDVQSTQMPQCVIEIDNVARDILAQVELAIGSAELITVTYRQYLSTRFTGPENDPPLTLTVFDISADVFRIRATCGFGDFLNKRFPGQEYTAERFPGLIAVS